MQPIKGLCICKGFWEEAMQCPLSCLQSKHCNAQKSLVGSCNPILEACTTMHLHVRICCTNTGIPPHSPNSRPKFSDFLCSGLSDFLAVSL